MNTLAMYEKVSKTCSRTVTDTYSTSFSAAIRLLHPDLRDPIHGIYGFVRLADEIVDSFHDYDKRSLLFQFQADTYRAIEQRISVNPVLHSFQGVVHRYGISSSLIASFFKSMYTDLDKKAWTSKEELGDYIYGSAEVVGLMCLQVFCEGNNDLASQLKSSATALGAAFQKVNFLRDLQDDISNLGRQYFPQIDFSNFSVHDKRLVESDILIDFEEASKGINALPEKARFGVFVAYQYYLRLFSRITRMQPQRLLSRRVSVPNIEKKWLFIQLLFKRRIGIHKWQLGS